VFFFFFVKSSLFNIFKDNFLYDVQKLTLWNYYNTTIGFLLQVEKKIKIYLVFNTEKWSNSTVRICRFQSIIEP